MMLFWVNPFEDMFNIKSYTKWYHYFWAMPLMCLLLIGAYVSNTLCRVTESLKRKFKRK